MKWYRCFLLLIGLLASFTLAQEPTFSVDVEPNSVDIQSIRGGVGTSEQFSIAVRGSNLVDVFTLRFTINFDPAKFSYVSAIANNGSTGEENFLEGGDPTSVFFQDDEQSSGEMQISAGMIGGTEISGDGLLAYFTFTSNLGDGESGTFTISTDGITIDGDGITTNIGSYTPGTVVNGEVYTVTVTAGANGSVNPSGDIQVVEGGNLSVEAIPDAGFHFTDWAVTGDITVSDNDATGEFVINSGGTITAGFAQPGMRVDMDPATAGIQAEIIGSAPGENFSVAIYGHDMKDVRSYSFHLQFDPAEFEYVDATESAASEQNFLIDRGASSTIFIPGLLGNNKVNVGNTISAPAVPFIVEGDGLLAVVTFKSLLVEGESGSLQLVEGTTVDINDVGTDISLFTHGTYHAPFMITISSSGNGTVTPSGSIPVKASTNLSVLADPDDNYHFDGWDLTGGIAEVSGDETGEFTINGSGTITGNFAINTYTVTFQAGANGTITGDLSQTVSHGGSCTAVIPVAEPNHHFTGWSGDYTGTDNPLTVSNVTSDMTITANFAINTYTVNVSSSSGGSTDKDGANTVSHGSTITITPTAGGGYHFISWSGDASGSASPLTVTVTSDMTITANFAINTYTVTFVAGANGSITGNLSQTVNHGGSCTQVTAVPATNYLFVRWTGDYTGANNPLTVSNVTANMTINAEFDLITPINNGNQKPLSTISFKVSPAVVTDESTVDFFFSGNGIAKAKLVVFDGVGNTLYRNSFRTEINCLNLKKFDSWDLRNRNGRKVCGGTFLAVLYITNDQGAQKVLKLRIGVKQKL